LCHKTAQPALSPRAALERQAPRPERSAPRKNYTQTSKPQSLAGPEELEKDNDTNRNSTVTHRSPPFIKSDFGPKTCLNWSHIPAMGRSGAGRRRRRRRKQEADARDRRPETGGGGGPKRKLKRKRGRRRKRKRRRTQSIACWRSLGPPRPGGSDNSHSHTASISCKIP